MAKKSALVKLVVSTSVIIFLLFFVTCNGGGSGENAAPVITSWPDTIASAEEVYTYSVTCSDSDGDVLAITVDGGDTCGGMVTDNSDGTGTYSVTPGTGLQGTDCTVSVSCSDSRKKTVQSKKLYVRSGWTSENAIRITLDATHLYSELPSSAALLDSLVGEAVTYLEDRFAVSRLSSNLVVPGATCGEHTVPLNHQSTGVADSDILIYVTAYSTGCTGSVTAYGSFCSQLASGRPLVGYLNICPGGDLPASDDGYAKKRFTSIAAHEMMHVLGFSIYSFENNPNGSMYQTFTERGNTGVKKITTTNAVAKVREYTGCPTLNGVELEDQGGTGTAGSHLESRLFAGELMAGIICDDPPCPMTAVTMAIMHDTGWYVPDYDKADILWRMYNRGCEFACEQKCDSWYAEKGALFCEEDSVSCNAERTHVGVCSYTDWGGMGTTIPLYFQYFAGQPGIGGADMLMDYCPAYTAYSNLRCSEESHSSGAADFYGATFGSGSKCFSSTLWDNEEASNADHYGVHCYKVENCRYNGKSAEEYDVRVINKDGGEHLLTCSTEGEEKAIPGYTGTLVCAPAREVCSDLK